MFNNNYIYTNSTININLMHFIIGKSKKIKKINYCPICDQEFDSVYNFKKKNLNIKITQSDLHLLIKHHMLETKLYQKICSKSEFVNFDSDIDWCLLSTNGLNIINGLYEIGSNQIYTENNKNISQSKISRFSEHSGFIYFEKNKISNVTILTSSRIEKSDPLIYMPKNCLEALNVNYIFHTHPKTPYIGSRIKNGIIYEFPSISDIIHFIEHHNNGKLLGSIIIAPEGIYIIRKNTFNRANINVDYDILIDDLEEILMECYSDSYSKYSILNYSKLKVHDEIKIPDNYFYKEIAINYDYIEKINNVLIKYDLFIDYYARILFNHPDIFTKKWIFDDIYVPMIN